jgi:transposase-like protein
MKVRRVRCPKCKSLKTIKNGQRKLIDYSLERKSSKSIQRYKCKECKRSFTVRNQARQRYTREFKLEITRMHVEERMSYRVISKRMKEKYSIGISKNTICRMVNEIACYSKGDIKIKQEYSPQWQGYLTVDDKYFSVDGNKKLILTATDSSGDLIHLEIFNQVEQHKVDKFFGFIEKRLKYPVKAITTDLDEMLEKSISKQYGNKVLHQKCLKHAMDAIDRIIQLKQKRKKLQTTSLNDKEEYLKNFDEYQEAQRIYDICKKALYSKEKKDSIDRLNQLINYENGNPSLCEKYPGLSRFIKRHLDKLLTHQKDLKIKKTNNIAENINRRLMIRLKTIESFKNFNSAENYLNLYKNYLRFKPYTDCRGRNKIKNGKSPLEVCGVVLKSKDWLKNAVSFY